MRDLEWESLFLERGKQLSKENNKKKKIRIIQAVGAGIVLFVVLTVGILGGGIGPIPGANTDDYNRLTESLETMDYSWCTRQMANHLNEKYGADTCNPDDIIATRWNYSEGITEGTKFPCLEGESRADWRKKVYMLFLSKTEIVYTDTYQWDEIMTDLGDEARQMTGIDQLCIDTLAPGETSYSMDTYEAPWIAAEGFITSYNGDLDTFFQQEAKARGQLTGVNKITDGRRINGSVAFYFGEESVADLSARIQDQELPEEYIEKYETTMRSLQDKYQIDLFSCVLIEDQYEHVRSIVEEAGGFSVRPSSGMDLGIGQGFYHPAYVLLSFAYNELYVTRVEEVDDGIYLTYENGIKWTDVCDYKIINPPQELEKLAKTQESALAIEKSFAIQGKQDGAVIDPTEMYYPTTSVDVALIVDRERLYPNKELVFAAESPTDGFELFEEESAAVIETGIVGRLSYQKYWEQDGYFITMVGLSESFTETCGLLSK